MGLNTFLLCRHKSDIMNYRIKADKIKLKSLKAVDNIGQFVKWKTDGQKENKKNS